MNMVVRTSDGTVSLLVDEIGDVLDMDAETYERPPENLDPAAREIIRGVYKLKDRLLLVLDAERTAELTAKGKREGAKEMSRQGSQPRPASSGHDGKELAESAVLDLPVVASPAYEDERLDQEITRLVEASREGRLSERGTTAHFEGQSRRVIEGVNEMLDAILLPMGEGNRILAQISAGKIDELIAQTYHGDHER